MASDDEWIPPKTAKPKPSNFALLKAKKKKGRSKTSVEFRCTDCAKRFPSKDQLKNHRKSIHGKLGPFRVWHQAESVSNNNTW